ncbi:SCO family protein [Ferruginivarius sediminum]|uniref:SCO family protein n=1 Tax=Ferruginivarius sediminum TaxID=2661937 RepID=A0A369TFN4_9PROT|nr:SCO family protein [Ferruginivarius sediminum]RDD63195.1 SCO family protein [Ferruginivarius sediminum]
MFPKSRIARTVATVSIALSLALVAAVGWKMWQTDSIGQQPDTQAIGGAFQLDSTNGGTVTAADFRGRYMLVFFGYTHCPDVCPATLNAMTQALNYVAGKSPGKADQVTPVFITIDPARDDLSRMKAYVENFHPRLVGLTGNPQQVAAAAGAYKVSYEKVTQEEMDEEGMAGHDGHEGYLMRHSSYIFLMGPDGRHVDHVASSASPTEIADLIQAGVEG